MTVSQTTPTSRIDTDRDSVAQKLQKVIESTDKIEFTPIEFDLLLDTQMRIQNRFLPNRTRFETDDYVVCESDVITTSDELIPHQESRRTENKIKCKVESAHRSLAYDAMGYEANFLDGKLIVFVEESC